MNNSGNRKHNTLIILLVAGSFLIVNALFFFFSDVFDILNTRINDQLFKLRYRVKGPEPIWNGGAADGKPYITLVELDDRGYVILEELQEVYGERSFDADIINILTGANVSGIAYDTVFAKEGDQTLVDATSNAGNLYYPVVLAPADAYRGLEPDEDEDINRNLWYLNVSRNGKPIEGYVYYKPKPELVKGAKGIGHINVDPDADGIFRRIPLLIATPEGGYVPSLTLRMAADYLRVEPQQIKVAFGKHILLENAEFPDGSRRDIEIPIDDEGQMIVNFAGKGLDVFRHLSYTDVLQVLEDEDLVEILRDEVSDNLVIVADVSSQGKDFGAVPLENFYPLSSIHANVLNSILTTNFVDRLDTWQEILLNLVLALLICVLAIKTRSLVFSAFSLLILILFAAFVLWLFLYNNTLTHVLPPLMGIVFSFIFVSIYRYAREEQEKTFLLRTFESYFAPSVLNKILKNPEKLESSERKTLSILFTDISGFTSWCSTREPEEIHSTLNEYYGEMARIIFKHEGTIDKYMGDGMMAFFGDPIEYDDHALRAVKAALEMQQKARELRERWKAQGRLQIQMRVGINTGEVVVGNMGSANRVDYTILGSNVNLAQRLESNAPPEGILISQSVYEELKREEEKDKNRVKDIKAASYGKLNVKGISEEIEVYQLEVPEPGA